MSLSATVAPASPPPVPVRPHERRLMGRALVQWDFLRGERRFPGVSEYREFEAVCSPENLFLIKIGKNDTEDRVIDAGDAVAAALNLDPVGRPAVEVLPSSRQMGLRLHRAAVEFKKPTADVGRFLNRQCDEIRYRCVLLPLSSDSHRVDHILGAFNYKIVPKD